MTDLRIGIDVGGTRTKWVALDGDVVADRGTEPTAADGPGGLAARVRQLAAALREPVASVGLALPAVIDRAANRPTIAPNLPPSWTREPVAELVAEAVGAPVVVCNDARAFALAEATVGAGAGARVVACAVLGTGVGGGVVIDGRPHGGRDGRAGELGHFVVEPDGALCACGGRGCLEAYAGGRALAAAAGLPTPLAVFEAARAGEPDAAALVDRAGRALGLALANVAILFAPDVVVIGGGVGGALDDLRPSLEATLAAQSTVVPPLTIRPATLGEHAGAIGAALWKDHT